MELEQYVAARYGRLVEQAVLLGCAEGQAGPCVDRVLISQRRAIRRAEDPDPLVLAALERAIRGEPEPARRRGPIFALGVVALVAVLVLAALSQRGPQKVVPSLFGLDGEQAERLLRSQGYDMVLERALACEPNGLVVGSNPASGQPASDSTLIRVQIAQPYSNSCEPIYVDRSDAWRFVQFAMGGPAPEFARTVAVVVDGSDPSRLDQSAAIDRDRWSGLLDTIDAAARQIPASRSGMPYLVVDATTPPAFTCGVARPPGPGDREALRMQIASTGDASGDSGDSQDGGCPLTVDLYRSGDGPQIDGVVVYSAKPGRSDAGASQGGDVAPP